MTWLFEDVTPLLSVAALLEVVLIFALLRSGERRLLFFITGVAIVCSVSVVIEAVVETEKERVEEAIEKTRQAVLTNESRRLQSMANHYLARFTVQDIKITDGPQLRFLQNAVPPSVDVTLNARFDFDPRKGTLAYRGGVIRVDGELRLFSNGWRWTDAEFSNPLSSTRNRVP